MAMTLSELIKKLQDINEEVMCDGTQIASHKLKSSVTITWDKDEKETYDFDIDEIDVTQLFGCGCWDGVHIKLKLKDVF